MPMATDTTGNFRACNRRTWLQNLGLGVVSAVSVLGTGRAWAGKPGTTLHPLPVQVLAACWDDVQGTHHAGWLHAKDGTIRVLRSVVLPTRGHGLALLPDGGLLVAARRPGDWLLRVPAAPTKGVPRWAWLEPGRVFSGHVLASVDGRTVFTAEIDTGTGQGLLGVRDALSLEKNGEWATHGMDPHATSRMPTGMQGQGGRHPLAGMLFVANGGIDTVLETGRTKRHLHRMDPSVACLHPETGALLGQWRLDDPRLSLRHLAWASTPEGRPVLGVALQAEHDDQATRAQAPLLAVLGWQAVPGGALCEATGQPTLAGYGGDVAVLGQGGAVSGERHFVVSATRGHALVRYTLQGQYQDQTPWADAGALSQGRAVWAGGRDGGLCAEAGTSIRPRFAAGRLDNHWLLV